MLSQPEYKKSKMVPKPSGVSAGRLTRSANLSAVVSPNKAQKYSLELARRAR